MAWNLFTHDANSSESELSPWLSISLSESDDSGMWSSISFQVHVP